MLKCYATEIGFKIYELVAKDCEGCRVDHPFQRRHECSIMPNDKRVSICFDDAVSEINEKEVIKSFFDSLQDMTPIVNGLELIKYTCNDWRKTFLTEKKNKLEHETLVFVNTFY